MNDSKDAQEMDWASFKTTANSMALEAKREGSILLFRGQSSSSWRLETTLERSELDEDVASYFRVALRIKPEVEAYTGLKWSDEPDIWDIEKHILGGYEEFSSLFRAALPHYSYLAYLRHHSFPSPLLDWSASAMVAAFFAFRPERYGDEPVAIYGYRERDASGMKSGGSDEPFIRLLGPYVSAPKRHFAQRSYYTLCAQWDSHAPYFCAHENVCKPFNPAEEFQQDILFKSIIPRSERDEVLTELASYNLNAYTLFGSEDSLMDSLAMRAVLDSY
ncbi:FRG domain-containing protein [Bradyrhizobium oligotrophicum]|uniref:FRG domain-containing protein n=1 Tax=Bradyrhizobium oligotrophicum TaxID=44255 RepID=UPI003EB6AF37